MGGLVVVLLAKITGYLLLKHWKAYIKHTDRRTGEHFESLIIHNFCGGLITMDDYHGSQIL